MLKQIFILTLISVTLLSARVSVAVLDFTGDNIAEKHLFTLSEMLRLELTHFDTLSIMDQKDMSAILANHELGQLKCSAYECAVVAGLLLDVDLLITVDVTKIGEVYLVQGRLYDPVEGKVLNTLTYDHELTLDGLVSRGMKNVALMLMSRRIPFSVHETKEMVYIKSIPTGANVWVGNVELDGVTPLAIDRVTVESQRITIRMDNYEEYVMNGLPKKDNQVFLVILNPLDPTAFQGNLAFAHPIPEGIYILSKEENKSILIQKGTTELNALEVGSYKLHSNRFTIQKGTFTIKPRKLTHIQPIFIKIELLEKKLKWSRVKRNILITSSILVLGYSLYLESSANKKYEEYLSNSKESSLLRSSVEQADKLKPLLAGSSVSFIIPAIYQQIRIFKLKGILRGENNGG